MVGDSDVENLAHLVEFGNPSFERDENRRREAVDALGSLTDQRAIVPLEGALQDENGRVRVSAVSALERHKAFDSLFTALHSKDNEAVSYTHLRAHETDSYLVCRLLLEKKKKISYIKKNNKN